MRIIALIGGASSFIACTLAQIYKKKAADGSSYGGPAYYIEAALHSRWLGVLFSLALIATYAGGFNMLCSYNLVSSLSQYPFYGDPDTSPVPLIAGILLALIVGFCLMGGGRRIIKATSFLVPVMGITYLLIALLSMILNIRNLPAVFGRIFAEAFDFRSIFGGFSGSALMHGVKRGLYSNEAGVGSAPNAAAAADVSHPAKQGLVQMLSVFLDTLLVCTATTMMCLSSGIVPSEALTGAPFVQTALAVNFGAFGTYFITFALLLFAFTTLIGNLFYCTGCLNYIARHPLGRRPLRLFYGGACLLILAGTMLQFGMVWNLADILMGMMALINLPVILILSKYALAALRDYLCQRAQGKNPVFRATSIGLCRQTDFWR